MTVDKFADIQIGDLAEYTAYHGGSINVSGTCLSLLCSSQLRYCRSNEDVSRIVFQSNFQLAHLPSRAKISILTCLVRCCCFVDGPLV